MINNYTTIALDKNEERVEIENAKKGAKYTCEGCGARKIAVTNFIRRDITKYFKHHPKDVHIHHNSCKWSDESTLHKLAKNILQINKNIKVPIVIKTSPDGDGQAYKIRDSRIIEAHSVEIEMSFFEDNDGFLKWKRLSPNELELLVNKPIRPDVSFFDDKGMPILLIEIVVSNDISEEKYLKIKRIGIDTVKVYIPTDSLESLNHCFDKTTFTKWVFNNDEQRTTYISISATSGKRVSSSDELEGGIHAENFNCRSIQIENFIRAVNKCLGQQSYASIKRELDRQLYESEQYSKGDSERLRGLQERYEREIESEFESERERIENEERELERADSEFQRYKEKKWGDIISKRNEFETRGELLRESQEKYQSGDQNEIDRIEKIIKSRRRGGSDGVTTIEEEEKGIEIEENRIGTDTDNVENEIRRIGKRRRDLLQGFDRKSIEFSDEITRIEAEFGELREELVRKFENRDFEPTSAIGQHIEEIINGGKILNAIISETRDFKELSNARKIIKSETWRDWDWS